MRDEFVFGCRHSDEWDRKSVLHERERQSEVRARRKVGDLRAERGRDSELLHRESELINRFLASPLGLRSGLRPSASGAFFCARGRDDNYFGMSNARLKPGSSTVARAISKHPNLKRLTSAKGGQM